MKGLGHAILTGETLIGDEPFAVVLAMTCASLTMMGSCQMVKLFRQFRCSIVAVEEVPMSISTSTEWLLVVVKDGIYRVQIWSANYGSGPEPWYYRPVYPDAGYF